VLAGLPGLAAFAPVAALGMMGGGYAPPAWNAMTGVLAAALAVCLLWSGGMLSPRGALMLAGLIGLTVWTGFSTAWSLDRPQSILEVQRAMLYAVGLAAVLLLVRRGSVSAMLGGVAAACTVIALIALADADADAPDVGLERPVGYANALGMLAVAGALLLVGLASRMRGRARRWWVALLGPLVAVIALSGSRGAWLALLVGVVAGVRWSTARRSSAVVIVLLASVMLVSVGAVDAIGRGTSVGARLEFWTAAWSSATDNAVRGAGAGSFERVWSQLGPEGVSARNAHNLYVETLAELGAVGLVLLVLTLAVPLFALTACRGDPLFRWAGAAYVALLCHAGFDADWEMPVLMLVALSIGASLVVHTDRGRAPALAPAPRIGAGLASFAVAGLAFAALTGNAALARAQLAADLGARTDAVLAAQTAAQWAPWLADPWRLLGEAAADRGDMKDARRWLQMALARDPGDPTILLALDDLDSRPCATHVSAGCGPPRGR
jgi:O-antigen ligase